MPREVITAAEHDRNRSLGWLGVAWMEYFCQHGPGDVQGQPVVHGDEYSGFIVDCYCLGVDGRRLYDSAFLSRPKGCDKSGLLARFTMLEAFGPCRFAGWARGGEIYEDPWGLGFRYEYLPGDPMGRPVTAPYIRCMATEESQTGNVYDTVYVNLTEGKLALVPGVDVGLTRIFLPGGGEVMPSTASSAAKDGGKETFNGFDETHLYVTPELRRMYATVTRNERKRKLIAETWHLETTTMFLPGEESVAEATYELAEQIQEGNARSERLLFDHRWGDCEDLGDEDALRAALVDAYGDAIEWNYLDGLVAGIYDPRNETSDSRRYFLNTKAGAFDAWLEQYEWAARVDATKVVADRDMITLGFDGSRGRTRGVADATALIACRVSDGHLFEPLPQCVWEQPDGVAGNGWEVPEVEVNAAVTACFRKYHVVGFYADPSMWDSHVAAWESQYGSKLKVKSTAHSPIKWSFRRTTAVVDATKKLHDAIKAGEATHDGSYALTRHVLNARRRAGRAGIQIAKEHPDSPRKIDAATAAILAWECRLAAVTQGLAKRPAIPRRIR